VPDGHGTADWVPAADAGTAAAGTADDCALADAPGARPCAVDAFREWLDEHPASATAAASSKPPQTSFDLTAGEAPERAGMGLRRIALLRGR
jgi:hypothetical protein